jgi:UDP-N-acetylmuramoyl-L-alanyl-D-glutamate--2,6-diaminopimelate ligase
VAGNTRFGPPVSGAGTLRGDVVVGELSSFQLEACPALLPQLGVLTNLTYDHLYRHGSLEHYGNCKRRLFVRGTVAIDAAAICIDQPFGHLLSEELKTLGRRVVTFGAHPSADRRVLEMEWTAAGSRISISEGRSSRTVDTRLRGLHNAENAAAAFALADTLGVDPVVASHAISETEPLAGRFELLDSAAPFDVVVDFAHNPDGIRRVLEASREMITQRGGGSLRVVLSCLSVVGEVQAREMGRVAAQLADQLVLTCQRTSPADRGDVLPVGLLPGAMSVNGAVIEVECDRASAIEMSIAAAGPGDVVLILGRGERDSLYDRDDRLVQFDDRTHARACLGAALPGPSSAEERSCAS